LTLPPNKYPSLKLTGIASENRPFYSKEKPDLDFPNSSAANSIEDPGISQFFVTFLGRLRASFKG